MFPADKPLFSAATINWETRPANGNAVWVALSIARMYSGYR